MLSKCQEKIKQGVCGLRHSKSTKEIVNKNPGASSNLSDRDLKVSLQVEGLLNFIQFELTPEVLL